jgi:molybdenum-dependent DNA-binding transcriptional regulator ModE
MINKDYLENLNDAQKEAVLHLDGPLLIVAGAGSGKTKVLTKGEELLDRYILLNRSFETLKSI